MEGISSFQNAVTAFGDRVGDIRLLPLAIALLLHVISLLVRSGVWCGILRAAFPSRRVEYRSAVLSYLIGVGANSVAPLRGATSRGSTPSGVNWATRPWRRSSQRSWPRRCSAAS
jgi:hypothetical protein